MEGRLEPNTVSGVWRGLQTISRFKESNRQPEGDPQWANHLNALCSTVAPQGTVLAPFLFTLYSADFTHNTTTCRKCQQTVVNKAQAAGESAELWRLHHGVSYLFSEAEGSCAEAQKFCLQKHSEVATMTNANKDWIASQAEGRKLWINMLQEDIVTGPLSMTVQQCPETGGSNPTQLNSSEKRDWMCERRREETPNIPQRFIRAAASDGDDDQHSNEHSEGVTAEYEEFDYSDYYYNYTELTASTGSSVVSVKTYVIIMSVVSVLCPLGRLFTL
ncbi:hypothetical protein NFI96_030613 [Prochilodus magdalenae]|nr:hypothetical protein NFI96_030613 [Prochilodus magdalenae]